MNTLLNAWQLVIPVNFFYWFLYRNEFAFIEQFKIEIDKPWPWKADPEGFRKQVINAFLGTMFNSTVTFSIM